MRLYKTIFSIALLFSFIVGCTDDFEELNQNPNAPENVEPEFLLSNIISVAIDENTYDQGFDRANYFAHFAAAIDFGFLDRYIIGSNSTYWETLNGLLTDVESMKNAPGSNEAYQAVGEIMSCFFYSQLTDLWNDVPYSESHKLAEGIDKPKYDSQESIYTDSENGILVRLKKASEILENTNQSIRGDVMFNNDLDKWVRFANSLRLRFLLRISKRLSDYSEIETLASAGKLMQSNDDNAAVPYLAAAPNQFPFYLSSVGGLVEHVMSKTVDSVLSLWNDPRVSVLYKPVANGLANDTVYYRGIQNGQTNETVSSQGLGIDDLSVFGAIFRDVPDGVDAQFMQYAEVQFALAEARQKGFITSGSVQQYYEAGVRASFEYYGVDVPADYFSREAITLDGTHDLTKIMTQKWLSLINIGHEAWFNIRRTAIPQIKAGPDAVNNGLYPVRYLYPESEQATNAENYQEAVNRIGGDNINSKGWWEK
ncbi:SusD/RagB family nutrient-binding outer membrane lipoprotein [Marivirga atlantica]|uniref:SusD/RagB family nutrient-binding outer membrane lipoprotein n=1 Tax=Marivirga atlantica TaxID=1548457 RepID=A0A937AAB6_9BACT|nr:SusD/RagB family nutrient-binding outer membrane lipoprotein [Marivirga atlantica]MBL0766540.1 SusD/RagB family nutrient-binding outer membrane lipoprotein [Marivirga atlantica]